MNGKLFLTHQIGIFVVYACRIILSYIPAIPARGKDKKRTAARLLHVGRTSIRDVIVMVKCRHHVASPRIHAFHEAFCMCFQYKNIFSFLTEGLPSLKQHVHFECWEHSKFGYFLHCTKTAS